MMLATATQAEDITFARPNSSSPVSAGATSITYWPHGHYEVLHLNGNVKIQQGNWTATANEAILWVERPANPMEWPSAIENEQGGSRLHKVIVYLEGQAVIELSRSGDVTNQQPADRIVDEQWFGRLFTETTVDLNRSVTHLGAAPVPEIFTRATTMLESGGGSSVASTALTQSFDQQYVVSPFTGAVQAVPNPNQAPVFGTVVPGDAQQVQRASPSQAIASSGGSGGSPFRVQVTGRDGGSMPSFKLFTNPQNENEQIGIGYGGFRIQIESTAINQMSAFESDSDRRVILLADRIVQWQVTYPDGTQTRQFYLEGNVVFAKDRRVIHAERMFYDIEARRGTILDAEVLTPVPSYEGLVRMKAKMVQQLDENNARAYGAAVTSSRLGVPRYWLQSQVVNINRQPQPQLDPLTNAPAFNMETGQYETDYDYYMESNRNRVYVAGVPVFVWPRFRANLSEPTMYLDRLSFGNDSIFGTQVRTGWNLYQILGWQQPANHDWIGLVDYLSERGLGLGSESRYQKDQFLGIPGVVTGTYHSWFIRDQGRDFLGRDRFNLLPEEKRRGRMVIKHRHQFDNGWLLRGEVGYISDRNFLEQYYEREWDTHKDATTGLWLERNLGPHSFNLTADYQINRFYTQTSWLPRFDHFLLGQSLFADRAVWHGHSHVGYGRMRVASTPLNATEIAKFDPLAWEADVQGARIGTRQEIDFPFQAGPVKVVPYMLGDLTFWQEDLAGNDVTRALGQVGIRTSLPIWKVDPSIQSCLWNVNGLAHKVSFDFEALYADASQDIDRFPLYDPLDDDAQEHFRRRFAFDTFGILPGMDVPLKYDERYFALRSGMQRYVTAPSMEIADDLALLRFGVRQRWQTKRGMPGQERIVDWITFDMHTTLFPKSDQDNSGADWGMFDYDFEWFIGDRFALLSDGYADFFSQGLRTVSLGGQYGRPETGSLYLGVRSIEGPISSNLLSAFMNYRMSPKWGVKAGGQVDLGSTGNIGQYLDLIYIGESFLWQIGANYDVGRDNFGFRFGLEPRFTPKTRLFNPGGQRIPPASSRWLE